MKKWGNFTKFRSIMLERDAVLHEFGEYFWTGREYFMEVYTTDKEQILYNLYYLDPFYGIAMDIGELSTF